MKRMFLLFTITSMCLIVAVGGTITFLNSNSVLKQEKQTLSSQHSRNIKLDINVQENKSNPAPSPKGVGKVDNNDKSGDNSKEGLMEIKILWSKFTIEYLYR